MPKKIKNNNNGFKINKIYKFWIFFIVFEMFYFFYFKTSYVSNFSPIAMDKHTDNKQIRSRRIINNNDDQDNIVIGPNGKALRTLSNDDKTFAVNAFSKKKRKNDEKSMNGDELEKHIVSDVERFFELKPKKMMHLLEQLKKLIMKKNQQEKSKEDGPSAVITTKKKKKKPLISLESVLTKTCKAWLSEFDDLFHYVKLKNAFAFMNYHKLRQTISDGALLAMERFNLFASPWDDDVDTTVPLDEAERIFQVPDVPGKYTDISRSRPGLAIYHQYCRGSNHMNVCFKVRIIMLEETGNKENGIKPDCISFEALNWGFLHVRYHNQCAAKGQKIFDIFIHYKCLNDESTYCETASSDYYDYIAQLTSVKPGKRFGGGFRPEWFDILVDVEHGMLLEKTYVSGVEAYVPPKERRIKYLNGIYPGWDKTVLICPHDIFRAFNVCNEKEGNYRPEYEYDEAYQIMLKIDDCKKVLNKGTLNDKMKEAIKKKENEALQLHLKNKKEHKYKATEFEYKKYEVGEIIEGKCCHWKKFYRGIVRQVNGDDTYYIQFDDGEKRPTFSYIFMRKVKSVENNVKKTMTKETVNALQKEVNKEKKDKEEKNKKTKETIVTKEVSAAAPDDDLKQLVVNTVDLIDDGYISEAEAESMLLGNKHSRNPDNEKKKRHWTPEQKQDLVQQFLKLEKQLSRATDRKIPASPDKVVRKKKKKTSYNWKQDKVGKKDKVVKKNKVVKKEVKKKKKKVEAIQKQKPLSTEGKNKKRETIATSQLVKLIQEGKMSESQLLALVESGKVTEDQVIAMASDEIKPLDEQKNANGKKVTRSSKNDLNKKM